jgi:Uma2 family endonuclease
MASRIEPLLTVADLDAYPDDGNRYELIEGEVYVSRAPHLPHQLVLQNLQVSLFNFLNEHPMGRLVPGAGAIFSDYDAVIPDILFVSHKRWNEIVADNKIVGAPDLVIEVLSPGKENRERDLFVKRKLYAKYGVKEYWIVDTENLSILIFHLHGQTLEQIATLTGDDELTSPSLPGFQLQANAIFNV